MNIFEANCLVRNKKEYGMDTKGRMDRILHTALYLRMSFARRFVPTSEDWPPDNGKSLFGKI
jgi:hypothetical protein